VPARDLAVAPTPVGPRRPDRRALAAVAVMAVAIGLAIGLAQQPTSPSASPAATTRPTASLRPPATASAAVPASAGPGAFGTPPRLARDVLRDGVVAGQIDEQLVFVDGILRVAPARCQGQVQGSRECVDLEIPGLGLPVSAGSDAIPWRGDPPPGAWIVTVARAGGLVYLGSLVPGPRVPDAIDGLTRRLFFGELATPSRTLFEVEGWLVVHPPPTCFRPGIPATPCPPAVPFLAADEPAADGALRSSRGGPVDLAPGAVDVDPGDVVTPGRFLVMLPAACDATNAVETCDVEPRWRVVARFDPGRSFRVLAP
jgi:hypothetical protein